MRLTILFLTTMAKYLTEWIQGGRVYFISRFWRVWFSGEGNMEQFPWQQSTRQWLVYIVTTDQEAESRTGSRTTPTLLLQPRRPHDLNTHKVWKSQDTLQVKDSKCEPMGDISEWNQGITLTTHKGRWLAYKEKCTRSNFRSSLGLKTQHCSKVQTHLWGSM